MANRRIILERDEDMPDLFDNAIELDKAGEDTLKDRYLTFSIGQETYGLEVRYVIEIVGIQKITEMPELPEYI